MKENNLQLNENGKLQHFLTIAGIPTDMLLTILSNATQIVQKEQHKRHVLNSLADQTIVNLFFETSTRTWASFELAAKRLGANVLDLAIPQSAIQKGETLLDTLYTLHAMFCRLFVIRHNDYRVIAQLAEKAPSGVSIINGGAGTYAHPSQAMLDVLTIQTHKPDLSQLSVAIIGDIRHSRVARSQIELFKLLGIPLIRITGPESLLPDDIDCLGVEVHKDMTVALKDVDVIIMLRVQTERMNQFLLPDKTTYHQLYGLDREKLQLAKPDAIVLHPGPINRDVEITGDVIDSPQSVIQEQVSNGIALKMAVMQYLLEA